MKICVFDTDDSIFNALTNSISDNPISPEAFSVRRFYDANELVEDNKAVRTADVFFINASAEGLISAGIIRNSRPDAVIILTSESDRDIYEAFTLEALGFLVKPFSSEEFSEIFRRMLAKVKSLSPTIHLRWKNERYNLPIKEIIYVEGYNRHLTFYTKDGEFNSMGKLKNLQERLCIYGFLRIHQGYTVSMDHIRSFLSDEVIMSDGTRVMISTRRKTEALRIYDEYTENKEKTKI